MSEIPSSYSMSQLVEITGVSEGRIRDLLITHMNVVETRGPGRGAKNFTDKHLNLLLLAKPLLEAGIAIRFVAQLLKEFPWLPQIMEDFLVQISENIQDQQDFESIQKLIFEYLRAFLN